MDDLAASHYRLVGPRGSFGDLPEGVRVISAEHTDRQTTLIVHNTTGEPLAGADDIGLEDMVLTYLQRAEGRTAPTLEETRA
jgi:ABC-2 type transport system ATP-binding protein